MFIYMFTFPIFFILSCSFMPPSDTSLFQPENSILVFFVLRVCWQLVQLFCVYKHLYFTPVLNDIFAEYKNCNLVGCFSFRALRAHSLVFCFQCFLWKVTCQLYFYYYTVIDLFLWLLLWEFLHFVFSTSVIICLMCGFLYPA